MLAGSKFIPYSPRWLLAKDRREEAFEIVKHLHASPTDPDNVAAKQEFYLMEKQFNMDKLYKPRFLEIFRTTANLRRSLVACLLMWGDQVRVFACRSHPGGGLLSPCIGLSSASVHRSARDMR